MYGNPKLDEWLKKMEPTPNESATSEKTESATSEKTETVGAEEKRSA